MGYQSRDSFYPAADKIASARWADPDYVADTFRYEPGRFWLGRNPLLYSDEIGAPLERHVFLCAETRTGKGRSIIINNLALWPGSVVSVDPKGENAEAVAERRGTGNEYCDGLGQDVYVLDPFQVARIPDAYRAYYDPMADLDPSDRHLQKKAMRIAAALTIFERDDAAGASWVRRGIRYVATLIMHVVTHPAYEGRRSLLAVRDLILSGKADDFLALQRAYDDGHETLRELGGPPSAFELLIREMLDNNACNGVIQKRAVSWQKATKGHDEFFESVRNNAEEQTDFLDDPAIRDVVAPGAFERTLALSEIKTDPGGISLFLCLPTAEKEGFERWQKLMVSLILDACKDTPGQPATGHKVLMSVDEFLSFGRMEKLETGMTEIAGAGVALFLAVQKIGPLKDFYKKSWETFVSGAGLSIWFGPDAQETPHYIARMLGETEIVRTARNTNTNKTESFTESSAHQTGESWTKSAAISQGATWNSGTNWQNAKNWGSSEGRYAGRNFGPHIVFQPLQRGVNAGSNSSRTRGGSESQGGQESRGGSKGTTTTEGTGGSSSDTTTTGSSKGYSIGEGQAEQFFKKPLLSVDEARVFLADRSNDEAHGAWPGLALINIAGEPPFFVRKALYDRDPKFVRCFTPHRDYPFVPFDQQPMVEVMFTPAHYVELSLAAPVWGEREYVFGASDPPSVGMIDPGEPLGHVEGPDFGFAGREHTQNRIAEHLVARLTSFSRAITFDENDAPSPDYADWRQNPVEPASALLNSLVSSDWDYRQQRRVKLELPVHERVTAALAERWDQRSRALLVRAPEPAEVISVTNTALLLRLRNPLGDATRDAWQEQVDFVVDRKFQARRRRLDSAVDQLEERLADEVLKQACARHLEHKREAQERRKAALIDWVKQEQNREKQAIKSLAKFIAAALVLSCLTPIGLTKTLELFGAHMSGLRALLMGLAIFTAMMLAYLIRTRRQLGETPIAKIRRFAMGTAETQLSQLRASDAANVALNPLYERLRDDGHGRRYRQGDIFPEWRWLVWLVRRPPAYEQSGRLEWETRRFLSRAASRAGDRTAQPSRKAVLAEMVDRVWPRLRRAIAGLWSDRGRDRELS